MGVYGAVVPRRGNCPKELQSLCCGSPVRVRLKHGAQVPKQSTPFFSQPRGRFRQFRALFGNNKTASKS
eukprot:11047260-Alexandrium_andersonii.AAC.1